MASLQLVKVDVLYRNRNYVCSPLVLAGILNLLEVLLPKITNDLLGISVLYLDFGRVRYQYRAHLAARETTNRDNHRGVS